MRQSKYNKKKRALGTKAVQLTDVEARLVRAIDASKHTGLLGSRSVFDDPKVRALMRHRDRLLRDMGRIRRR